ncbi:MAG: hypothetical protein FJ316_08515 [SAR202 cluster bacterium]|nr:hypothetical protein [SAR202 cluster bacterium]
MMEVLTRLGVHWPSLVIYTINFLVFWAVLHFVAVRPFLRKLQERRQEAEARQAAAESIQKLQEEAAESRRLLLAQAQEAREALLRSAQQQSDRLAQEGRERGQRSFQDELERARQQIQQETEKARQHLRGSFVELVAAAAGRALGRALDEREQAKLVEEAAQELAALPVDAGSPAVSGWAIVTTAAELNAEQRRFVETRLAEWAGRNVRVIWRVSPAVIGGISVHAGDVLLDATVSGRLEQLRQSLMSQE